MHVSRAMLPGPTTVVVVVPLRTILIDFSLDRDDAALAIQGVLPDAHTDVIDHWVDTAFPRSWRPPFSLAKVPSCLMAALALMAVSQDLSLQHVRTHHTAQVRTHQPGATARSHMQG